MRIPITEALIGAAGGLLFIIVFLIIVAVQSPSCRMSVERSTERERPQECDRCAAKERKDDMKEYVEREMVCNDCANQKICVDKSRCPVGRASAADVVSRAAFDQVMWERDVAIQQLREDYGVGLGEKKAADVVESKRGHWIDTGMSNSTGPIIQCSACKKFINPSESAIELGRQKKEPDFCEKCGADMRGICNERSVGNG